MVSMKKILCAWLILSTPVASAAASDLSMPSFSSILFNPDRTVNWTGTYIGVHAGKIYVQDKFVFQGGQGYGTLKDSSSLVGAHVGAQYQHGIFVAGVELDVFKSWIGYGYKGKTWVFDWGYNNKIEWQASARARVGIAYDRFLIYGAGGAIYTPLEVNYWFTPPGKNKKFNAVKDGLTYAFGVEYAFTDFVSFRSEIRRNQDIKSKESTSFNRHSSYNATVGVSLKY